MLSPLFVPRDVANHLITTKALHGLKDMVGHRVHPHLMGGAPLMIPNLGIMITVKPFILTLGVKNIINPMPMVIIK